jgi:hypothetical protein
MARRYERCEECVIETKIQAEENKNARSDRFGETAVEIHGLVDPVAVTEVPDEATEIAEGCSLKQPKRSTCFVVREQRP